MIFVLLNIVYPPPSMSGPRLRRIVKVFGKPTIALMPFFASMSRNAFDVIGIIGP